MLILQLDYFKSTLIKKGEKRIGNGDPVLTWSGNPAPL
jgi:hypothetical protein